MKFMMFMFSALFLFSSCSNDQGTSNISNVELREEMRNFVIGISKYSKAQNPNFLIVPQNGIELITNNGEKVGTIHIAYLNAIDAHGQEDLFFGYDNDNVATAADVSNYLCSFLDFSKTYGKKILVTDYCSSIANASSSLAKNSEKGYTSFVATRRELDIIPAIPVTINSENAQVITSMSLVKNYLYLIDYENFTSKTNFINAVIDTNYDLLIMDLFFTDGIQFTASEIAQLRNKKNGGKRLVISYMSIGEAESYRYYWQSSWNTSKPVWLDQENPDWQNNFKVKYWNRDWQSIIYGNENSYVQKVIDANFDGVYLDIVDAFEYYEQ